MQQLSGRDSLLQQQMRVLVTGGRDYQDRAAVFEALDALAGAHFVATGTRNILVIHGACCSQSDRLTVRGADRWAQDWAMDRELPYVGVPAQWSEIAKGAGRERNLRMLEQWLPTNVVAFPGGPGTRHMTEAAQAAGIVVWEPEKQPASEGYDAIRGRPRRALV